MDDAKVKARWDSQLNFQSDTICIKCSRRWDDHSGISCFKHGTFSGSTFLPVMTDKLVNQFYNEQGSAAFDSKHMCTRCASAWGYHNGIICVNNATSFFPDMPASKPSAKATGSFTWSINTQPMIVSRTVSAYKDECPCGIHPSRCDYHR